MNLLPALLSSLSASTTTQVSRTFRFVPFGSSYKPSLNHGAVDHEQNRPTIACDGRVPGVTLELTHWNENTTPDIYYADTSTEMALQLPESILPNAVVLNNHYDTDGVLSVFACLNPTVARQHANLLTEAAAAGDFGEWTSDRGIRLDAVLLSFSAQEKNEEAAYDAALAALPRILDDMEKTGGMKYQDVWKSVLDHAHASYQNFLDGSATLRMYKNCPIAILQEPSYLSCFAVHRALNEAKLSPARILRVQERPGKTQSYDYNYEMPGHGWVAKLRDRKAIPTVKDAAEFCKQLGSRVEGAVWKTGGPAGMVAIACAKNVPWAPEQVAACIEELEESELQRYM